VMSAVNSSRRSDQGRSPSSAFVGGGLTLITRVGSHWRAVWAYDPRRYRYHRCSKGLGPDDGREPPSHSATNEPMLPNRPLPAGHRWSVRR
jgi:hypothetical protein